MAAGVEQYRGREQSFIKHEFLTQYLQAAAFKTLQGRSRTFNFVDAFAGPWEVSDTENLSDTSFSQALDTLEAVRVHLGRREMSGLRVRLFLCETRSEAVAELRRFAANNHRFDIRVFHGKFEDNLDAIATECRGGFTFTFIDPTGWDIRSGPILEYLRKQDGEFLLNFMSEHINRHAEFPAISASIGRFLADPDWESAFNALPPDRSNEERVLTLLQGRIRASGAATYLPDFSILKPRQERVKMRLLFGTHSGRGVEVFRNVQEKVERTETETRSDLLKTKSRQTTLFPDDMVVAMNQGLAGVGCTRYRQDAAACVRDLLSSQDGAEFAKIWPRVLEAVPVRLTHLKKILVNMKAERTITFELPRGKRVPQPETLVSLLADPGTPSTGPRVTTGRTLPTPSET